MQFKDNNAWQTYNLKANSKDEQDNLRAAIEWAETMEGQLDLKMEFGRLAELTLQNLTQIHVEINMRDYAFIVKVLGECWKHGDDLLNWHNQKYAGSPSTSFVAVPTHI